MTTFDFDLLVVGGGSGGVRAARVALVEADGTAMLGGTCVNVGCIFKKLYSYAAHYHEAFEESHGFGWEGEAPKLNWATLKASRKKEISRLNGIYLQLLTNAGVKVINGFALLLQSPIAWAYGRVGFVPSAGRQDTTWKRWTAFR